MLSEDIPIANDYYCLSLTWHVKRRGFLRGITEKKQDLAITIMKFENVVQVQVQPFLANLIGSKHRAAEFETDNISTLDTK